MGRPLRIFISSTAVDLLDYRQAASEAIRGLDQHADDMVDWSADDRSPSNYSVDRVKESDVLILLLAHRYGTIPEGEQHSITELEYQAARDANLPVHVFIVDPKAPWPPQHIQHKYKSHLRKFKARVSQDVTPKQFRSPHDLALSVTQALAQPRAQSRRRSAHDPKRDSAAAAVREPGAAEPRTTNNPAKASDDRGEKRNKVADRQDPSAPAQNSPRVRKRTSSVSGGVRLTVQGQSRVGVESGGRLRLMRRATPDPTVLIAADGALMARRETDRLHVAWVNRITGHVAEWRSAVELTDLGDGALLAVGMAGPGNLAFIWAADEGTDLYYVRHPGGSPDRAAHVSDHCASGAVLLGCRALLAVPAQEGTRECSAFPDLDVDSIVGASMNGRVTVLAIGNDASGDRAAWAEFDGRERRRLTDADVCLQLDLSGRNRPVIVSGAGDAVAPQSEVEHGPRYEHWLSQSCATSAATA